MNRSCYGFPVVCSADSDAAHVIDGFFGAAAGPVVPDAPVVRVEVDITEQSGDQVEPPYFPENWETADEITINVGRTQAIVDPAAWTVHIALSREDLHDQIVWGRWILERAFIYLVCRSRRHYPLHAGAVAVGGRTAVVTADSGVGKSTFSAWALRRGADFAGEDIMVRHMDDESGTLWGYPRVTYLSPQLLELWPQLEGAQSAEVPKRDKFRVILPSSFEPRMLAGSVPHCLLFLARGDGSMRDVDVDDAVERTRSDWNTGKIGTSFEADVEKDLRGLLEGMPVWELALTPDFDANHDTLVAALERS